MKFRKKAIVIDAEQYQGDATALSYEFGAAITRIGESGSCFIDTICGEMECRVGDWIIRGVAGEFYPCTPEVFAITYESVIPI